MKPVNRGTKDDPVWIMPCCGGHEVCFDHCASNEAWDDEYDREVDYWNHSESGA